jgi:hypothetical protein
MLGRAAHPDLAIGDPDRRSGGIAFVADAVHHPEHRHDRAFQKRHRRRQGVEPRCDPAALRGEKLEAVLGRDAVRQHQLDLPGRGVDAQQEAARPRVHPNRYRRPEVERAGATLRLLDGHGADRADAQQLHVQISPLVSRRHKSFTPRS